MRPKQFFDTHPVFRHDEFVAAHAGNGRSPATSNNVLAQHVARGRLLRIRRGLYATVPSGENPDEFTVDPYLIACHLAPDAALAYHAALQFFGRVYSVWRRFHYLTAHRARPFTYRGLEFVPIQPPEHLRGMDDFGGGLVRADRRGGTVTATCLERTLVDLMDAPDNGGSWEEIWRSLEMVEYFDVDLVIDYASNLRSAIAAARVAFFLEQHQDRLMVEDESLARLETLAPQQPRYLDPSRQPGQLLPRWNLIVPSWILERTWETEGT